MNAYFKIIFSYYIEINNLDTSPHDQHDSKITIFLSLPHLPLSSESDKVNYFMWHLDLFLTVAYQQ